MMRTKNTLRNTLVSVIGSILIFVFGIALRSLFLQKFDITYLGYEGLFSNLFSVLATFDLGAGALLLYKLYRSIAIGDEIEIRRLIAMFAHIYRLVALITIVFGLLAIPLLPYLIQDNVTNWRYVHMIYLVQLFGTVGSVYFSYYRLILEANQRLSDAVKIEVAFRIASQFIKFFVILYTKSYLLYLAATMLSNMLAMILIAIRTRRRYSPFFGGTCALADLVSPSFRAEIKDSAIIRLTQIAFYLTDTVLISSMIGLRSVALYGNYTMIGGNVLVGFNSALQPVRASAGNYANTESDSDSYRIFCTVDLISFFAASFVLTSLFVLFQPVISFLYGEIYLLSFGFLAFYCLQIYISLKDNAVRMFRETVGEYSMEKKWAIAAAIVNIVLSVVGIKLFGITGAILGTVLAKLILEIGNYSIAYQCRFHMPVWKGLGRSYFFLILTSAEAALTYFLCSGLAVSLGGIAIRAILCVLIPNAINVLLFFKTESFQQMRSYLLAMIHIVKEHKDPSNP